MTTPALTVIVPTFNRPDGLTLAVRSLYAQTLTATGFTLIIVDNAPDHSAAAIAALKAECPPSIQLIALREPKPGVANARNMAMSAVETDLVAFLDDDQSAPADWLERLLASFAAFPAPVTFGPVRTALPDSVTRHRRYFSGFFARDPGHDSGYIDKSYGCGNALIDFSQVPGTAPYFDSAMNEIGGEDDMLFASVRKANGHFAWAADAPVFEHPPLDRIHLRYTLRRAFAYGQGPCTIALKAKPPRYATLAKWMFVGAVKGPAHGLIWLAMRLIGHKDRAYQIDASIRGFAKLLWWVHFRFYGAAALKPGKPSEPAAKPQPHPATDAAPADLS